MIKEKVGAISGYRKTINQIVNGASADIENILKRKDLIKSDRQDLAENARAGIPRKVDEQLAGMSGEYRQMLHEAKGRYQTYRKQDSGDLADRASLLMPVLNSLEDKELINLFNARAGDRLDREIISELIKLKVDISGGVDSDLATKYRQIDNDTIDQLPEKEREARKELQAVELLQEYVDKAIEEGTLKALQLEKPLKGIEGVRMKNASFILEQMEKGNIVKGLTPYNEKGNKVTEEPAELPEHDTATTDEGSNALLDSAGYRM